MQNVTWLKMSCVWLVVWMGNGHMSISKSLIAFVGNNDPLIGCLTISTIATEMFNLIMNVDAKPKKPINAKRWRYPRPGVLLFGIFENYNKPLWSYTLILNEF